jgi:hypothetical protein
MTLVMNLFVFNCFLLVYFCTCGVQTDSDMGMGGVFLVFVSFSCYLGRVRIGWEVTPCHVVALPSFLHVKT